MEKLQIKAFTLVELIITIVILAILGTIAFISMQSYSSSARDATRITDLSSMKTTLELFHLDAGKYPETTSGFIVTYSGSEVWTQGIFGESTMSNVEKLDRIPKDPLTDKEYTYSILKTKQEYQLAGIMEGDDIVYNDNSLFNQTNAGEIIATAIVTGNYNGQTLKTESGVICEILSLPSIVSSEESTDLETILNNRSLVYNGYNNLPSNYKSSKYKINEGFDFESEKLVVYSDTQECKPLYDAENATARINLVKNLQTAYSGTLIENADNIVGLVALDTNNLQSVTYFSAAYINNNLGGDITTYTVASPICGAGQHSEDGMTCIPDIYIVSGSFGASASGATINVCGTNVIADASGNFTTTRNNGDICNTITATKSNYSCSTTTQGPVSLTGNVTNIVGSCILNEVPLVGWRALDSNCNEEDIIVGSQIWAGCNSTLGVGFEWGKKNNGTNGTVAGCMNYDGVDNIANCPVGASSMSSNTSAKIYFNLMQPDGTNSKGDSEVDAIWGKLYTQNYAPGACPTGRHLPTGAELVTLVNTIAGTSCGSQSDTWQCDGLGWMSNGAINPSRKLVEKLKMPLAGNRFTDGISSVNRGRSAHFWATAGGSGSSYTLGVARNRSEVAIWHMLDTYGLSVRCLKN